MTAYRDFLTSNCNDHAHKAYNAHKAALCAQEPGSDALLEEKNFWLAERRRWSTAAINLRIAIIDLDLTP